MEREPIKYVCLTFSKMDCFTTLVSLKMFHFYMLDVAFSKVLWKKGDIAIIYKVMYRI
jgi:hypothetical protein